LLDRFEPRTRGAVVPRVPPGARTERRRSVVRPVESAHVALGWRAVGYEDPDRYALAVANQLIGVGLSSRLFQEIREERGLAYSVYSSMTSYSDSGVFDVYAGTTPSKVDEVLRLVDEQIADVVANGPTEQELAVAKGAFQGSTLINLEDTGSRMARLATSVVLRDRVTSVEDLFTAVASVSTDDVRRVAGRVLGGAPTIATVGPRG
jgi:predicted Zn-dependent peptidase